MEIVITKDPPPPRRMAETEVILFLDCLPNGSQASSSASGGFIAMTSVFLCSFLIIFTLSLGHRANILSLHPERSRRVSKNSRRVHSSFLALSYLY
jgi:hypothetical protein